MKKFLLLCACAGMFASCKSPAPYITPPEGTSSQVSEVTPVQPA